MIKLLIIILLVGSLFASESSVKVLNETTVKTNNSMFDNYIIQTICKDNYQYTVVIKGSSISITQDLEAFSGSTDPRIVKCDNK